MWFSRRLFTTTNSVCDGGCSYVLPTAQVCRLGPKVGRRLVLFCIRRVNRLHSRNDSVTESCWEHRKHYRGIIKIMKKRHLLICSHWDAFSVLIMRRKFAVGTPPRTQLGELSSDPLTGEVACLMFDMTSYIQDGGHDVISRLPAARCFTSVRQLPANPPSACDVSSWSTVQSYLFINRH